MQLTNIGIGKLLFVKIGIGKKKNIPNTYIDGEVLLVPVAQVHSSSSRLWLVFQVFLMDIFGLKTLYARGDLVLCSMAGVAHVSWHSNETVYKTCIEKWLT